MAGAEERAQKARSDLDKAEICAKSVSALQSDVSALEQKESAAQQEVLDLDQKADSAAQRAATARDNAARLRRTASEEIGSTDPEEADRHVKLLLKSNERLRKALEALQEARVGRDITARLLAKEIESSSFSAPDEARHALRNTSAMDELRQRIDEHDDAAKRVSLSLADPDLQELPVERPNVEASAEALNTAQRRHEDAMKRAALSARARDSIRRWAKEHRHATTALATARDEADLWTQVANRCSGRTDSKVSLQRWVLSVFLDEICYFANQHLAGMTADRYSLKTYEGVERHKAKAGLGLRIQDAHTGQDREASTLSGGETFQASLALALGMADTVAKHSGGVQLEMLFVDEGFGTLDAESLETAMNELDQLREGGRTIGLISHVAELRDRIRTGIEVLPSARGSTVRVGDIASG